MLVKPQITIKKKLYANQFQKPYYKSRQVDYFNTLNLIHLLVWFDEDSLSYEDDKLKIVRVYKTIQKEDTAKEDTAKTDQSVKKHIDVCEVVNKDTTDKDATQPKANSKYIVYSEGVYDVESNKLYNVIETLKQIYELSFPQACYLAKTFMEHVTYSAIREYCETKYPSSNKGSYGEDYNINYLMDENLFRKPDNDSYKTVYSVLHNRLGIGREIVTSFIHSRHLIMDKQKNICFLTTDERNNIIYVTRYLRHRDYNVTDTMETKRNVGFQYASTEEAGYGMYRNLYVFETVIDLMSYLTLANMKVVPKIEKSSCLLALNGINQSMINNFLSKHPEVRKIYTCLQNDNAGIRANQAIKQRIIEDMQPILRDYSFANQYVRNWNAMLKSENYIFLHKNGISDK